MALAGKNDTFGVPHGSQLLFGWFDGPGFTGAMKYLTTTESLPAFIALLVIMLQFFGALAILLGFLSRFFSLPSSLYLLVWSSKAIWVIFFS